MTGLVSDWTRGGPWPEPPSPLPSPPPSPRLPQDGMEEEVKRSYKSGSMHGLADPGGTLQQKALEETFIRKRSRHPCLTLSLSLYFRPSCAPAGCLSLWRYNHMIAFTMSDNSVQYSSFLVVVFTEVLPLVERPEPWCLIVL